MSKIVLTAASRVGCVRSNNEDMILAYDQFIRSEAYKTELLTESTDRFVIALADGMGGHKAGEIASADVLSNLQYYISDLPRNLTSGEFNECMVEWLDSVHKTIESKGHVNPEMSEMGTTLVGVVYYNGKYYWLNCGDSRLYRFRDGVLHQISVDHSLNTLKGEKRHSNILTNCIGGGSLHSYLDIYEFTDEVLPGDVYMLCSDGLSDMVPDADIERMMSDGATANDLCEAAIVAGGYDNVSVCIFKVE
jgi:protein phosphatase